MAVNLEFEPRGYRRLFIMRRDLGMSAGKLAAQVSHCAEAYWLQKIREWHKAPEDGGTEVPVEGSVNKEVYDNYVEGAIVKTICQARNKTHLLRARDAALSMNLVEGKDFGLIRDNCLTELRPEEDDGRTITGIWFAPLPDHVAHKLSKKYQLYK